MQKYFLENPVGQKRAAAFFKYLSTCPISAIGDIANARNSTSAGLTNAENQNLTWGQLSLVNAERIMRLARPFAEKQTKENLIHLKDGQVVGEWRDSEYGMSGLSISSKEKVFKLTLQ
jgi:hypothetical protein